MNIAIIGNSGSGKSSAARALRERFGLEVLALDEIVWEPGQLAVQRPLAAAERDLRAFLQEHEQWVVEGCYSELIAIALERQPMLVLMNPGLEVCLENNRKRPWEPEKYASEQAQQAMFENLQAWVSSYYERDDPWSYQAHRRLFDGYDGPKREMTSLPEIEGLS